MSQERSARTRRLLLDAAAGEFAEHGYAGARLQTVVDRIGMTKGALYGHFSSKDELAAGVAVEASLAWETLRRELAGSTLDAGKELRFLAERLARLMDDDPAFRATVRLAVEGLRESAASGLLASISAHTTALVRRAQAEQTLAVGFPPAALADLLTGAIFAGAQSGDEPRTDRHTRLSGLWDLLGPARREDRPPSMSPTDPS